MILICLISYFICLYGKEIIFYYGLNKTNKEYITIIIWIFYILTLILGPLILYVLLNNENIPLILGPLILVLCFFICFALQLVTSILIIDRSSDYTHHSRKKLHYITGGMYFIFIIIVMVVVLLPEEFSVSDKFAVLMLIFLVFNIISGILIFTTDKKSNNYNNYKLVTTIIIIIYLYGLSILNLLFKILNWRKIQDAAEAEAKSEVEAKNQGKSDTNDDSNAAEAKTTKKLFIYNVKDIMISCCLSFGGIVVSHILIYNNIRTKLSLKVVYIILISTIIIILIFPIYNNLIIYSKHTGCDYENQTNLILEKPENFNKGALEIMEDNDAVTNCVNNNKKNCYDVNTLMHMYENPKENVWRACMYTQFKNIDYNNYFGTNMMRINSVLSETTKRGININILIFLLILITIILNGLFSVDNLFKGYYEIKNKTFNLYHSDKGAGFEMKELEKSQTAEEQLKYKWKIMKSNKDAYIEFINVFTEKSYSKNSKKIYIDKINNDNYAYYLYIYDNSNNKSYLKVDNTGNID